MPRRKATETESEVEKTELIEQGLSLLAEQKLAEIEEQTIILTDMRAEAASYGTQAAQVEADRAELIRFNAELEKQRVENEKRLDELDKVHQHQRDKQEELNARAGELDEKAAQLAEISRVQSERATAQDLENRRIDARKAKMLELEQTRQA